MEIYVQKNNLEYSLVPMKSLESCSLKNQVNIAPKMNEIITNNKAEYNNSEDLPFFFASKKSLSYPERSPNVIRLKIKLPQIWDIAITPYSARVKLRVKIGIVINGNSPPIIVGNK